MKFKYGNKAIIEDDFFGKKEVMIIDYKRHHFEDLSQQYEYLVVIGDLGAKHWFRENELKKYE